MVFLCSSEPLLGPLGAPPHPNSCGSPHEKLVFLEWLGPSPWS